MRSSNIPQRISATMMVMLWWTLVLLLGVEQSQGSLSPPYFDIGKGKNISATATCGEDFTPPPQTNVPGELFCTLAELHGKYSRRGWSCSYCVPGDKGKEANGEDSKDHNIRNANDGSNRWWQSPPLSRGLKYRDINITIDLGQVRMIMLVQLCAFLHFWDIRSKHW